MSILDNYNTEQNGKRRTLDEIMKTPTAELTQEEKQLLIDLPSMSHDQLAARFTAEEVEWIERSHKLRKAFSQIPSQNQLKIFNSVADHLTSVAESFAPFVNALVRQHNAKDENKKMPVMDQEAVLLRCVLEWHACSARGEKLSPDRLAVIAQNAFNEQVGDASGKRKASNKKINAGKWSTSAHAHAMTYHPEVYDGQPHLIPVHRNTKTNRIDRVQPMLLTFTDDAMRVKYSQGLNKKQRFGLNLLSNIAATRIISGGGYAEFTGYMLAEDAQGGGRRVRPSLVENFSELLEIGCHIHGTIFEEVRVKPEDGTPDGLKSSDKAGKKYSGIVLPFDSIDNILPDRIQRIYFPLQHGALPLTYRAGEGKSQILHYQHSWIALPDASYTDDRLFAVYYLMEHIMQAQKRQQKLIKDVASRARRSRGKSISQAEIIRLKALCSYDADKNADLSNFRFDTLFENLEIDGEREQSRMKNFLIENVLKYWQGDPTMPLKNFSVKRSGKKVTGIQFSIDLPEKPKK